MVMRVLAAMALLAAGCGPKGYHARTGPALTAKPDDCGAAVFLGERPAEAFEVVGQVEAEGTTSFAELIPVLQTHACRLGADAVVDVRNLAAEGYSAVAGSTGGVGNSFSKYKSVGLAVRFAGGPVGNQM